MPLISTPKQRDCSATAVSLAHAPYCTTASVGSAMYYKLTHLLIVIAAQTKEHKHRRIVQHGGYLYPNNVLVVTNKKSKPKRRRSNKKSQATQNRTNTETSIQYCTNFARLNKERYPCGIVVASSTPIALSRTLSPSSLFISLFFPHKNHFFRNLKKIIKKRLPKRRKRRRSKVVSPKSSFSILTQL